MDLNNGFYEMSKDELIIVEGGSIWSKIVDGVGGFLSGRLVWTNASYMIKNIYKPIEF